VHRAGAPHWYGGCKVPASMGQVNTSRSFCLTACMMVVSVGCGVEMPDAGPPAGPPGSSVSSRALPPGAWGGASGALSINPRGASYRQGCIHGSLTGPIQPDSEGYFRQEGRVRVSGEGADRLARFNGHVDGKYMYLRMTWQVTPSREKELEDQLVEGDPGPRPEACQRRPRD
jgi:hypothetical protein